MGTRGHRDDLHVRIPAQVIRNDAPEATEADKRKSHRALSVSGFWWRM